MNSLIALETGAVRDEQELFKWNGVKHALPAWNSDQTMREAFKNSTVWVYQELARRIGPERMQKYVALVGYGNQQIGGRIDHFWLNGSLRITAKEQIDFLVKLYGDQLPFSRSTTGIVKAILTVEQTSKYTLRGKAGWAGLGDKSAPKTGWWVGFVETNGKAYFFAYEHRYQKRCGCCESDKNH